MKEFRGIGASVGNAEGVLMFFEALNGSADKSFVEDPIVEIERLRLAEHYAKLELEQVYAKALTLMSAEYADIFKAHIMLLESPDFFGAIEKMVKEQKLSAEYAVEVVAKKLSDTLKNGEMLSPIDDIKDVSECLLRNLRNEDFNRIATTESIIICADELVPSQVLEFHKSNIVGFCLIGNKHSSHVPIIAKALGIPAIIGLERPCVGCFGKNACIDGQAGILTVDEN
ncbi:MAG: phosphoenolpyruvate-utilizing N-terminal domain-containing protein [Ruminococcus sp.]|nr:phosphoenolpyruvate-utilizing N-terminal domain-containing protein [Ruminococcus sp.]